MRTTKLDAAAASLSILAEGWGSQLASLLLRVGKFFARAETRRNAADLVDGLLADLPRKNCWTIAEHAGHRGPDRLQNLLFRASWDADAVLGEVRAYVYENLAAGMSAEQVVLVFDETGDQKKGS